MVGALGLYADEAYWMVTLQPFDCLIATDCDLYNLIAAVTERECAGGAAAPVAAAPAAVGTTVSAAPGAAISQSASRAAGRAAAHRQQPAESDPGTDQSAVVARHRGGAETARANLQQSTSSSVRFSRRRWRKGRPMR